MPIRIKRQWLALSLCGLLLASARATACSTPVYRWALEKWDPDPYTLFVYYDQDLLPEQEALLSNLSALIESDHPTLNLYVDRVSLAAPLEPAQKLLWQAQEAPQTPWMVLRYPHRPVRFPDAWQGPLTAETLQGLVDSPTRKKIVERLAQGDAAVWVLLESGNVQADTAARESLNGSLATFPEVLSRVQQEESGMAAEEAAPAKFAVLGLKRTDPAETAFISLLLGTEPDLHDYKEPMAFPVFGRGRVLYALIGQGIQEETIQEACLFLATSCSCEVKEQNPGVDLLFDADWLDLVAQLPELAPSDPPLTKPDPMAGVPVLNDDPWWAVGILLGSGMLVTLLFVGVLGFRYWRRSL